MGVGLAWRLCDPDTVALLGSIPRIGERKTRFGPIPGPPPDPSTPIVGCPLAPRLPLIGDLASRGTGIEEFRYEGGFEHIAVVGQER